jgi:hypothetical protein
MALKTTKTVLIPVPGYGTIRITPQGGRVVAIAAPEALEILDRQGRQLERSRKTRPVAAESS